MTLTNKEVACGACGHKSHQYFLDKQYNFDLFDYNDSLNINENIKFLLQQCPNCGYIETDISKPVNDKVLDFKKIYKPFDELYDSDLAARFAKYACYLSKIGGYKGACDSFLYSAYIYDGLKKKDRTHMMLRFALDFANELAFSVNKCDRKKYMVLRADILRRVGEFEKVFEIDINDIALDKQDRSILLYEKELAKNKDQNIFLINSFK